MRWRQAILAAGIAVALGAVASRVFESTLLEAIAIALVGYVLVRVLVAAYYRTRYWLGRPNKRQSRSCGNCGQYIYRRGDDLHLQCGHCGWTAGWPGLRWVTRSVPARQVIRSITWQRLGVIALAGLLVVPITVPVGGGVGGAAGASGGASTAESVTTATSTPTATATNDSTKRERIETAVHEKINDRREKYDLRQVERDDALREIARSHSRDMADQGYFDHESPDGDTFEDRYREAGYECRANTGGERYLTGGENIWMMQTRSESPAADEIAKRAVQDWMASTGHRENILTAAWDDMGIGVYIFETVNIEAIYVTQNFC